MNGFMDMSLYCNISSRFITVYPQLSLRLFQSVPPSFTHSPATPLRLPREELSSRAFYCRCFIRMGFPPNGQMLPLEGRYRCRYWRDLTVFMQRH